MAEGSTVDLTKERGFATAANLTERQSDVKQGDDESADNNKKLCFKTALIGVASGEPVAARLGKGEKESDEEAEVSKEWDGRAAAEIDVVSDEER